MPPAAVLAANLDSRQGRGSRRHLQEFPGRRVKTVPPPSVSTDVDPSLKEIQVTFSKPMTDKSWSWVQHSKPTFPELAGAPRYENGERTCVLPP